MSGAFKRPTFSRDITGLVGPQQAPPIQTPQGALGGVPGLAGPGVPAPPPPELQTRTVTQTGISPARAAAADFFTAFGGGPEAALIQQQRRFERPQIAFDIKQEQADKQTQLVQQKFQNQQAGKRLTLLERKTKLDELKFPLEYSKGLEDLRGKRLTNTILEAQLKFTQNPANLKSSVDSVFAPFGELNGREQAIRNAVELNVGQTGKFGSVLQGALTIARDRAAEGRLDKTQQGILDRLEKRLARFLDPALVEEAARRWASGQITLSQIPVEQRPFVLEAAPDIVLNPAQRRAMAALSPAESAIETLESELERYLKIKATGDVFQAGLAFDAYLGQRTTSLTPIARALGETRVSDPDAERMLAAIPGPLLINVSATEARRRFRLWRTRFESTIQSQLKALGATAEQTRDTSTKKPTHRFNPETGRVEPIQ